MIKAFRKTAITYAVLVVILAFAVVVVVYFLIESRTESRYSNLVSIQKQTIEALEQQQGVLALDTDISGSSIQATTSEQLEESKEPELLKSGQLTADYFNGVSLRISDLVTGTNPWIRDKTFENCVLYGPSMLIIKSKVTIAGSIFSGTPESIFPKFHESQLGLIGVIALENVSFKNCRFIGIGIIAPRDFVDTLRSGKSVNTKK